MQTRGLWCSSERRRRSRRATRSWQQLRRCWQQCLHAAGAQRTVENPRDRCGGGASFLPLLSPPLFVSPSFFYACFVFWRAGGAQRLKEDCRNIERAKERESERAGERETAALASAFWRFAPLLFPHNITRFMFLLFFSAVF
jgi:hypothetical protein